MPACRSTRRDGTPCQATTIGADGYCWAHSPALAEQRAEARRQGGRNSAKIVRLRAVMPPRLVAVFDLLEQALQEVHAGDLSHQQATAMANLARAMATVLTAGELEQRVRELEERAK